MSPAACWVWRARPLRPAFSAHPGLLSAFEVAAYVPTSLYDLIIGGMVNSALVPVFSDYAAKEKRQELWAVLSTVLSVATALLLVVVALVILFAPQIAWLVGANEFDDPQLTQTAIHLMRMAAPAVLFLSIASILTGALYALRRFTVPAFIGAVFNATVVVVALLRPDQIESLVWGILLGSMLQIVVQLVPLRDARLRWRSRLAASGRAAHSQTLHADCWRAGDQSAGDSLELQPGHAHRRSEHLLL